MPRRVDGGQGHGTSTDIFSIPEQVIKLTPIGWETITQVKNIFECFLNGLNLNANGNLGFAEVFLELLAAGEMIRMGMSFEYDVEFEFFISDKGGNPGEGLVGESGTGRFVVQHRIHHHRIFRLVIKDDIGHGKSGRVKKCFYYHRESIIIKGVPFV